MTGNGRVDTSDVVAIQRFFLGQPFGTANVGKYKFTPVSLSYPTIATDQTNQDYSRGASWATSLVLLSTVRRAARPQTRPVMVRFLLR